MSDTNAYQSALPDRWAQLWISHTTGHAIFALSESGEILSWNPGAQKIYGYSAADAIGRHWAFLATADDDCAQSTARVQGTESDETEGWHRRHDGTLFWANVVTTAVEAGARLLGFVQVVRDVSDRRRAHDAAVESERSFRLLVEGVTDYSIFMLSPGGLITSWNLGASRIKGYSAHEIIGSHFSRFYTPDDAQAGLPQRALDIAALEGRFESEGWRVRRDGSRFWAHVIVDAIHDDERGLIGFAKITRDITEKREADALLEQTRAALFQSQKMDAVGKLTGGVAHDFNNVLQVLRGNLELLQLRCRQDDWFTERLLAALDAVDRGARLASHLLAFARRQALQPVATNLSAMVGGMDDLLRRALGETVAIETVVAGGLWNAFVDVHQLENVVLNLAINARDAMPDGGKLTLELANAMLDDHYVRSMSDVPAGQYVMLAVTDTGTGMSPEVIGQAFDPFFTTKPEGEGTGLGLSMAYGFVKQSGGHIRIYSELGHGTTIRIYLPRTNEEVVEPLTRRGTAPAGGLETILVVEDDRRVQATVIEMLTGLGYTALKADHAEEALVILQSGIHVDLLFTDVVMPGPLKSPEMARRAVQLNPDLRVLFTSGYTQNAIVHGGRLDPGVELLSKPYSRDALDYKLRHLLGRRGSGSGAQHASGVSANNAGHAEVKRILVVEDDEASRAAVCEILAMHGHAATGVATAAQAFEAMRAAIPDVLLSDIHLPDMSGIDLARQAIASCPGLQIVFASGDAVMAAKAAGFEWTALRKPFTSVQLLTAINGSGEKSGR